MCLELEQAEQKDGGETMTDSLSNNKLTGREREAILKALVLCYRGEAHLAKALNETKSISKGTDYNSRDKHLGEIKRLHAEAKAIAMRERSGD